MIKLGLYGSGSRTKALIDSLIQDEFYQVCAAYDLDRESCRHRALGDLKIVNVSLPVFDPRDEWFDE